MKRRAFTVTYDDDSGEMVDYSPSGWFDSESGLMRADVLRDALGVLEGIYQDAKVEAGIAKAPEVTR